MNPWSLASEPGSTTPLHAMDVWHFEYFRVVCAKELSLYPGTGLWETLVLRAALAERCILSGVLALGALSRNAVPNSLYRRKTLYPEFPVGYSLRKYNLAIQELNRRLAASPSSWNLAVLGSIIFIAIESLQGNHDGAKVHLNGALAILESHGGSNACISKDQADMVHVLNVFSQLDGKSLWSAKHSTLLRFPALPSAFASISEARDSLNSITGVMNILFRAGSVGKCALSPLPLSPALVGDLSTLSRLLDYWQALFTRFIGDHVMDIKTTTCTKILLIQHRLARISVSTRFSFNQSAYDAHNSDFSYIIDLATEILQAERMGHTATIRSGLGHTFDIAVVNPLFHVACKCRDSMLRRRAIDVMDRFRGEGFNDTRLLARVARCVVSTEENTSSATGASRVHIQEEDRLQDIELDFDVAADKCRIRAWKRFGVGDWREVNALIHID